ncbi:MAG TPA: DUF6395 domain-containing protein [Fulvivirga sp.]|nr:DUF6395 domain-containing protein [Fulvivirga sp.]
MIFSVFTKNDKFIIRAATESPKEKHGYMFEGNFRPIELIDDVVDLEFGYIPENIHPDVIALICFCAFYPYLTRSDTVTFPMDISELAKSEFEKFLTFSNTNGKIENHDPIKVKNYSAEVKPYKGENRNVIAFGGGMDSSCLHLLFPEYELVTQLDNYLQEPALLDYVNKLKNVNPNLKATIQLTNMRSLNKPYGFTGWLCVFLLPFLVAGDRQANGILAGAILGSAYLSGNGNRFNKNSTNWGYPFNLEKNANHRDWIHLFEKIGFYYFSPVSGISELLTAKLIYEKGLTEHCLYCQRKDGKQCHQCEKCFRKNLEIEYWEYINTGKLRPKEYWDQYNNEKVINYYKENYRYFGHIMNFVSQSVPKNNKPDWFIKNGTYCNANTSWITRVYSKSLKRMPKPYLELIKERLSNDFDFMNSEDTVLCENYDCDDYAFADFNRYRSLEKKI